MYDLCVMTICLYAIASDLKDILAFGEGWWFRCIFIRIYWEVGISAFYKYIYSHHVTQLLIIQ